MKKLILLVAIALTGCSKDNICIHCEKHNAPTYDVCEEDVPEISIVSYNLTNNGYVCERY